MATVGENADLKKFEAVWEMKWERLLVTAMVATAIGIPLMLLYTDMVREYMKLEWGIAYLLLFGLVSPVALWYLVYMAKRIEVGTDTIRVTSRFWRREFPLCEIRHMIVSSHRGITYIWIFTNQPIRNLHRSLTLMISLFGNKYDLDHDQMAAVLRQIAGNTGSKRAS